MAQIVSDAPDESGLTDVPAMRSALVKPTARHSMFEDASFFDSIARSPTSRDPMNKGLLSKDVFSKQGIDGSAGSIPTEEHGE